MVKVNMALNWFKCLECGEEFRTKKLEPVHCENAKVEKIIVAPSTKFLEIVNPETGKTALVGQHKILKERARNYSRDVEMHDLIQMNPVSDGAKNNWINDKGEVRKKIDDV